MKQKVTYLAIEDSYELNLVGSDALLYPVHTSGDACILYLNEVSYRILKSIAGKKDIDAIVDELMEMYLVEESTVRSDIVKCTEFFLENGVIEAV